MEKTPRRLKWLWFLSPLPTLCVWGAIEIACVTIYNPDFISWYLVYGSFAYIAIVVGWTLLLLVIGRNDPAKIVPPRYFVIFWVIVLILELTLMAILAFFGIGQFQTFWKSG